jgi:hypothetical protein
MEKLRLNVDGLKIESFEPRPGAREASAAAFVAFCSVQPTCGNPSRGEETYQQEVITRYACCV